MIVSVEIVRKAELLKNQTLWCIAEFVSVCITYAF
jgi:hypothetical protein